MRAIRKLVLILTYIMLFQISYGQKTLTINRGNLGQVYSIYFSPDGKYVLSGSGSMLGINGAQDIVLWSIDGYEIRRFTGHSGNVTSLSYSQDGSFFISAGGDGTIRIWNTLTGEIIKTIEQGFHTFVASVELSPISHDDPKGSKYIISGGGGILEPVNGASRDWNDPLITFGSLKLWDTQTGKSIREFIGHTTEISSCTFSPDGKYVVSGDWDGNIKVWNMQNGNEIKTIKGHNALVQDISFTPDGKHIISKSESSIKLWDALTGQVIRTFNCENYYGSNLAINSEGNYIISGGNSQNGVVMWDLNTGIIVSEYSAYSAAFVVFSPNGKQIVSGGDSDMELFNTKSRYPIIEFESKVETVDFATFSPTGKYIATVGYDGIKILNTKTGKGFGMKCIYYYCSIVYSPDEKYIAKSDDDKLELLNAETGKQIWEISNHKIQIRSIAISPDGNYIVSGDESGIIKISNMHNGTEIKKMITGQEDLTGLAYTPDGKYIVSGNKSIILWDAQTGKKIWETNRQNLYIRDIAISPDGNYIASGMNNGELTLWNLKSGKLIRTIDAHPFKTMTHSHGVSDVGFSNDGRYMISCGRDNLIKLWNIKNGQLIRILKGHTGEVTSSSFSPNGKYIVSSSNDGTMIIWETDTGKLLTRILSISGLEFFLITIPNGNFDGSNEAVDLLYYVDGMDIIPLSSLYEKYYTPNLLARVMAGEEFSKPDFNIDNLSLPPQVNIISPNASHKSNNKDITINVSVTDKGGGIDEIRLYLNGKLVKNTQRGFKAFAKIDDMITKVFNIQLSAGNNIIKATAFNTQRTESIPDEITMVYNGAKKSSNLHMLVIGIDEYKNQKYNLNYAVKDASTFKDEIEQNSNAIFGIVNTVFIKNTDATRESILKEFNKLISTVSQEDVFVFYYAGHGVMSMEDKSMFYIVPYNVTSLYGNLEMLQTKAISGTELQTFSTDLKAQKQLYIFDACQSGGITELLASRGAAEEKALAQLARSTGTYWLAASGSEQFATEFAELGHGLFTYCVLLGLQGQADGESKDNKITVKELSSFLDDKVPELAEKHKGTSQYPSLYGYGMDFPVVIVKQK